MKNKFYVALMMDNSVRYVTETDWASREAKWEDGKPALPMTKCRAESLYLGLRCNGFKAVTIAMPDYEQPCNPAEEDGAYK